jgi:hypothetical protein
MATQALIHNGCTTAVEAYVMRIPAISYRATIDEKYDYGFYALPNQLSHQCFDFDQLQQTLSKILAGELGAADGDKRLALIDHHLSGHKGPLACERIIDVLEKIVDGLSGLPNPLLWGRLEKWIKTTKRRVGQRSKLRVARSDKSREFQSHKYPEIFIGELRSRVSKFQQVLGKGRELKVEQIYPKLFRIGARH